MIVGINNKGESCFQFYITVCRAGSTSTDLCHLSSFSIA